MDIDYREDERASAIARRIRANRRKKAGCRCDRCFSNLGATQHEIFPRGLTKEGTYKRDLCLSKYVISMLCMGCHSTIQNDAQANRELLEFNRELWGYDMVNNHIREMRASGINTSFQERTTI